MQPQLPATRVAAMRRGCQAGREYPGGRPHGAGSGRWQLRFVCSRRVSHPDPRSVPRPGGHSGPAAAAERSGQGRLGGGAARSRLPPARSLARSPARAAARALRSSSARELSQRFAPPLAHWPAARAASQWSRSGAASRAAPGLPAEPQSPAECERRPLGAPRPGSAGPGGLWAPR